VSWRPHLSPTRLPVSAAADVELTVEATPAPLQPTQPALPPEPSPAAPPPPEPPTPELPPPEPPPPEPPPPEPPSPEPLHPEPAPVITPSTAPAAPRTLPPPRVQSPRVPRPVSRPPLAQAQPPLAQAQPSSSPTMAAPPPAATAAAAAITGSASADSSYTGSIRAIIDRRNRPPDTAEYRLLHPHGTAEVSYTIARNGTVSSVRLVHSSGSPILDRQALANVAAGGYPAMAEAAFAGQAQHGFTIRVTFNSRGDYDP